MLTEAKSPLLRCGYFHFASGVCHMGPEPPLAVRSFRMADEDEDEDEAETEAETAGARGGLAAARGGRGAGLVAPWGDGGGGGGGGGGSGGGGGDGGEAAGGGGGAECKDWCEPHVSAWEEKCGYFHCASCVPCLDAAADPAAYSAAVAGAAAAADASAAAAAVAAAGAMVPTPALPWETGDAEPGLSSTASPG